MLQRLRKTLEVPAAPSHGAESTPLLPESVLASAVGVHPLTTGMGVDVHAVRDAVLALHARVGASSSTTAPAAFLAPSAPISAAGVICGACAECGSPNTLNARSGEVACSSCGVVCTSQPINVQPEYTAPAPPSTSSCKDVQGVPRYMVRMLQAPAAGAAATRSGHWHELEHWNAYARLTHEQLEDADVQLRAWQEDASGRQQLSARIAAVLLYPRLLPLLRSEESARRHIYDNVLATRLLGARSQPFPVAQLVPAPTHACAACGTACHTAKDARFHCRSGFGKRKRGL